MSDHSEPIFELPHVNISGNLRLSNSKYYSLVENHNSILDGMTISSWFLEELSQKCLLTNRQKRNIEAIEDQRAKAGLIVSQVYNGSDSLYDNFIKALKNTNQEELANLLRPTELPEVLSIRLEQDIIVKLQKNKHLIKKTITNWDALLEAMIGDGLLARDEKTTVLIKGPEVVTDRLLDVLYMRGLSVLKDFLRFLNRHGYSKLAEDIENTSINVAVNHRPVLEPDSPVNLVLFVRMIKISSLKQRSIVPLPTQLHKLFKVSNGSITKMIHTKYSTKVTKTEVVEDTFRVELRAEKDAPLAKLRDDYFSGLLHDICNEIIKKEKSIRKSDCQWFCAFCIKIKDILKISEKPNIPSNKSQVSRVDSDPESDSSSEFSSDEETRPARIAVEVYRPTDCNCKGDGSCVQKTDVAMTTDEKKSKVFFNILSNHVKSFNSRGKTKIYNYGVNDILRFLHSDHSFDYSTLTDNNGYNILHIIVLEGRRELLQVLSITGIFADLEESTVCNPVSNLFNMNALAIARRFKMKETEDTLIKLSRLERTMPRMHKMARIGDIKAVNLLLERHPQMMSTPDLEGNTALQWGVISGKIDVVKALVAANADVKGKTFDGETMLGCAVNYCYKDIVKYLVEEQGIDPEEPSANLRTPLAISISNKDFQMFRQLVEVGAVVKDCDLTNIVLSERRDILIYALSQFPRLNIDYADARGKTSLIYACETANKDIFKNLVERKANCLVTDKAKRNILFAAILSRNFDFFKMVVAHLEKKKILSSLLNAKDLYVGSERLYLVSGRDKGILGYHYIETDRVYLDLFRSLIRSGGPCDVAKYGEVIRSGWGTPTPEVRKQMGLRYDIAHFDVLNVPDMTALHYALITEQTAVAKELIRLGAHLNVADHFGLRPIHLACMRGYADVLNELVERKCEIHVLENKGFDPLTVAKVNKHFHIENFFEGHHYIEDVNLNQFRKKLFEIHEQLKDESLHMDRKKCRDVRQAIIFKLRDLTDITNTYLWQLGTCQIQYESAGSEPEGRIWSST